MRDVAARIEECIEAYGENVAFRIGHEEFSYRELARRSRGIQAQLETSTSADERLIAVAVGDHIDAYAAVAAVLRAGKAFVPVNLEHPSERNRSILEQAGIRTLVAPAGSGEDLRLRLPVRNWLVPAETTGNVKVPVRPVAEEDLAYLLFTSGSTGAPKGVPITRGNLSAFLDGLAAAGCAMGPDDRVLQMFDLTFDFSIATYLAPLTQGAAVHTVGAGGMKFMEVYRLLDEHRLTVAPMVPSVLTHLRPYFEDIDLPALRLSFFCGEALHADLASAWQTCAANAELVNFYGPTEATVFAMFYRWRPEEGMAKTLNGVVSIGRPMAGVSAAIRDPDGGTVAPGEQGELCLAGPQVTPGYWNDPARNQVAFFTEEHAGSSLRFYRTGDLALEDGAGDFLFCGRADHQVKLQGFRVELGEVEHHCRAVADGRACVVDAYESARGATELLLVVEDYAEDPRRLISALRSRIPSYMVPTRVLSVPRLPLNANGKIDRIKVRALVEAENG